MWSDEEESHFGRKREPIVETWEEYAQVYRSYERFMTISEHDRKETVRVFFIEQDVPPSEDGVLDFVPTNMLSAVFLHTHKGKRTWLDGSVYSSRDPRSISDFILLYSTSITFIKIIQTVVS